MTASTTLDDRGGVTAFAMPDDRGDGVTDTGTSDEHDHGVTGAGVRDDGDSRGTASGARDRRRGHRSSWPLRLGLALACLLAAVADAQAQSAGEAARMLLRGYDQDVTRIDRARDLLETVLARDGTLDAAALVTLSHAWYLFAEERARTDGEKIAAWERGRDMALRAIALAPDDAEAHLYYAINLGSWAQAKGLLRSLLALRTLRAEVATVLRLDPRSIEAHIMAGSIHRELPAILGGDRVKAEEHFRTARALDPHLTGTRIELALLYIKLGRTAEARRELQDVLDEPAPTDRPRWTLREAPRARELLRQLGDAR